jgi:hypothetical protein
MNDFRIREYVDDIFKYVKPTEKVREQKEELIVNISERVRDYVSEGLSFDAAFETARSMLGDTDELTKTFEKGSQYPAVMEPSHEKRREAGHETRSVKYKLETWAFTALAPFIYLALGFAFGWWAWGWIIIPVSAIVSSPIDNSQKIVALSPFVYILMGRFMGLWAWGWMIIPISAILSQAVKKYR